MNTASTTRPMPLLPRWLGLVLILCAAPALAETWGRTFHGPWNDWWTGTGIADLIETGDGGLAAVGASNNHGVILKTDADGTLAWSRLFQADKGKRVHLEAIWEISDGGYIAVGYANPEAEEGGLGWDDLFAVRLSASGNVLWERLYGRIQGAGESTPIQEFGKRVYENGDGTFTVTGTVITAQLGKDCPYTGYESGLVLTLGGNGELLDHHVLAGSYLGGPRHEVYKTSDEGYLVALTHIYDNLGYTLTLQKYDPQGRLTWSKAYYTHEGATPKLLGDHSVVEVDDGYLVNTGIDGKSQFLFKTDFSGTVQWQKRDKIRDSARPLQIVSTHDGGSITAFHSDYTTVDAALVKRGPDGDVQWANFYSFNYLNKAVPLLNGGYATSANAFDVLLAKTDERGLLGNRCSAFPVETLPTVREDAAEAVAIAGKGPITCNAAITAGEWTSHASTLATPLHYRNVNACVPKMTFHPGAPFVFPDTKVGESSPVRTITLSNYDGLGDLLLGRIALSDPVNFAIRNDNCSSKTLSHVNFLPHPYECTIEVVFTPKSGGAKTAALDVQSNNGEPPAARLEGKGIAPQVTLTVSVSPNGGGTVSLDPPGGTYAKDTPVTLTPQPASGFRFDHWEGALAGNAVPAQLALGAAAAVTAAFVPDTRTVATTVVEGEGTLNPASRQAAFGSSVSFDVIPAAGYRISTVSGCGGTLAGTTYTTGAITADCTVSASFARVSTKKLTVLVNKSGKGKVTAEDGKIACGQDCRENYPEGSLVVLKAVPAAKQIFKTWKNCPAPDGDTCRFEVSKRLVVTAVFKRQP